MTRGLLSIRVAMSLKNGDEDTIRSVINEFSSNIHIDERSILNKLSIINDCFSKNSVEEIIESFGIRAHIIDKDKSPKWNPSTLDKVHDDQLDLIFKPFEDHDLELQIPVDEEELYRWRGKYENSSCSRLN
uniref:3-hydroxyisobutyryl-CoA hydrolase n=1 Tax=Solanum lycopersicum TaxID=4081 RepID=K4CEN2_SOLLC